MRFDAIERLPRNLRILHAVCLSIALLVPCHSATAGAEAIAKSIPHLISGDGTKYTNVTDVRRLGDKVTFVHDEGVATLAVTSFNDSNLDQLFPGHIARKQAAERAAKQAEEEQERWRKSERSLAEANLQKAIVEARESAKSGDILKCVLVEGHQSYVLGQEPVLLARLVNTSPQSIYLLRHLVGSSSNRIANNFAYGRFPACDLEFRDAKGLPVTLGGLGCGTMNLLKAKDFTKVEPGEAFDPFADSMLRSPITVPGNYTVRFFYSTQREEIEWYHGNRDMFDLLWMFERMPKVAVWSADLSISFVPPQPAPNR